MIKYSRSLYVALIFSTFTTPAFGSRWTKLFAFIATAEAVYIFNDKNPELTLEYLELIKTKATEIQNILAKKDTPPIPEKTPAMGFPEDSKTEKAAAPDNTEETK